MKFEKPLAVIGAAALMFMATDAVTYAATGSSLVLGRLNQANATTTIQNTGTTPALKLVTKSAATAPLVVNGKGKVTNLYADRAATADNARRLGGRTPGQIVAAATGAQYGRELVLTNRVDTAGLVGDHSSITIGADALPIISYNDATNGDLKVAHCANLTCISVSNATAIDTVGGVGYFTSITIGADALPIISYLDATNNDLKVAHCANLLCTSVSNATAIDTVGFVGYYTSITIGADSLPIISYIDGTNGNLKAAHCNNVACTTATTAAIDTAGDVGYFTSITIGADGLPIISYQDSGNGDLKVARCTNAACTAATTTTVDTLGSVGGYTSITVGADGLAIISYTDFTNRDLKVARCNNVACTTATTTAIDTVGDVGYYTSIAIGADALPIVSYYDSANRYLKVARCTNTACTAATKSVIDFAGSAGGLGGYTAITIGDDGQPVISYAEGTNTDLKVARIKNTAWAPNGWGR